MNLPFYSVGHSTRSLDEFTTLLGAVGVQLVVDVRTVRKSRRNPQYTQEALTERLPDFGLTYAAEASLGGLRPRSKAVPEDTNGFWENQSFHNYADYALSNEFQRGLNDLIEMGREKRTAFMCSEAVWWRCHRRIISDYLLARGETVYHLMGEHRAEPAHLTTGAVVQPSGLILYPALTPDVPGG